MCWMGMHAGEFTQLEAVLNQYTITKMQLSIKQRLMSSVCTNVLGIYYKSSVQLWFTTRRVWSSPSVKGDL